jgi:putative transposase
MALRKTVFRNGEIYHIILRSVEGIEIFKDLSDYFRMIFSLYEFNNNKPVSIWQRRKSKKQQAILLKTLQGPTLQHSGRDVLVEIFVFTIMPNHIHLLVSQVKEGGISKFLRKLGTGYAMYFNKKYDRMGHLFQGFFKAVHINTDDQLKTDFVYIHTNGISLIEPKWKEVGIKNPDKVIDFLENKFRWSSLWDYFGKKNFPSVTERDFMLKIMEDEQGCREAIENWVKYKGEIRI